MGGVLRLLAAGSIVGVIGWFVRYYRSVGRGDYKHAEGVKSLTWIPGSGTHGGDGGQTPPIVPDDPDWDPDRRIR